MNRRKSNRQHNLRGFDSTFLQLFECLGAVVKLTMLYPGEIAKFTIKYGLRRVPEISRRVGIGADKCDFLQCQPPNIQPVQRSPKPMWAITPPGLAITLAVRRVPA